MFLEKLVGILLQVEQLGLTHAPIHHIILDQFPVAPSNRTHARLCAAGVHAVQHITNAVASAFEHRTETGPLYCLRGLDPGEVTECAQRIEQVDVALRPGPGLDPRSLDDEGHAPGVFVQVLLALETVPPYGNAMVRRVEDVGVVQLAHLFELLEDPADLDVDVLTAGKLPAHFVSDRTLVSSFPHTADLDLVAQAGMAMVKRMGVQVVYRQWRLLGIGRREAVLILVVGCAVLAQQVDRAVARIVRVGKPVVDQERSSVLALFTVVEVIEHLFGMPRTARLGGVAALAAVVTHCELLVGRCVAVAFLAGPHGSIACAIEYRSHGIICQIRGHQFRVLAVR